MEQIREYFKNELNITESDKDWQIFSSKLKKEAFPKKYLLLKKGQTENYLSFIEKGIIRFYIPKEDNDITFDFAFEGNFISGYSSFLTRASSTYSIETLTKTTVWRLTYSDMQIIYNNTEIGNKIGRKASEQLFIKKSKREQSLLSKTAEELYLDLLKEQPELIRQIPLKYLASYIGITPQALSRIRSRIS